MAGVKDLTTKQNMQERPIDVSYKDEIGATEILLLESPHMFTNDDSVDFNVCSVSNKEFVVKGIRSHKELEDYIQGLDEPQNPDYGDETNLDYALPKMDIFFLQQPHSRGRLSISHAALTLILEKFKVFPRISSILTAFTVEDGPYNEGRSGIYAESIQDTQGNSVFETAYLLKHVELHGRPGTMTPWSIRQFGIYQKFDTVTKHSSCIFIQTSLDIQRRLAEVQKDQKTSKDVIDHWTCLHLLCIGTLGKNWAVYIKFLDKKVAEIYNAVQFAKLEPGHTDEVSLNHLQTLNQYVDLLVRATHVLQLNITILTTLSREATKRRDMDSSESAPRYKVFEESVQNCLDDHAFIKGHVGLVRERAERIAVMLRDTIAVRDNEIMKSMTHMTIQQTDSMCVLTERSIRDARTVKTITFVTLVYLPASFTSTFLGMGFIHVESADSTLHLNASQDMWFYLAITAPLMVATLLGWYLWELRSRHVAQKLSAKRVYLSGKGGEV